MKRENNCLRKQSRHEFPCTSKEERPSIACVGSMVNCVRRQARENEEKIKKTHQHCLPCLQNGVSFLGLPKASSTPGKEWVWIWEIFIAMTMLVEGIQSINIISFQLLFDRNIIMHMICN